MHRTAKCFFNEPTMSGPKLLCASDQTTRRIVGFVLTREYVFRKLSERACISNDRRGTELLQLLVITFESIRRKTQRVEVTRVGNESLITLAQTIRRLRIEVMSPKQRGAATFRNTQ